MPNHLRVSDYKLIFILLDLLYSHFNFSAILNAIILTYFEYLIRDMFPGNISSLDASSLKSLLKLLAQDVERCNYNCNSTIDK